MLLLVRNDTNPWYWILDEYFLVYFTVFSTLCPDLVAFFNVITSWLTIKQHPDFNFSITLVWILIAFTFKKSIKIHGQKKELFISFLVVKSASDYLSSYRFSKHLKLIGFSWWFCNILHRACFSCYWSYSILSEANQVKFLSKMKIFSSSNWCKNLHVAKYLRLD